MGSIIDPITGLPYDALDTTLYSIPLDSQPSLAPEWNPQGRISSTVYPDNIPTVFATGQAQNELNPKTVQAMTMDGVGNLNVNVKAQTGGGGGATAIKPTVGIQGFGSFSSEFNGVNFGPQRFDITKKIWIFSGIITVAYDPGATTIGDGAGIGVINTKDGTFLPLIFIPFAIGTDGALHFTNASGGQTLVFDNGLDLSTFYPADADIAFGVGLTDERVTVQALAVQ